MDKIIATAIKGHVGMMDVLFNGSNFIVVDFRDKLRKHKNYPYGDNKNSENPYSQRNPEDIKYCVLHQTAGQIILPPKGIHATNNFVIDQRGWAMLPYALYLPFTPPKTSDGRYVIYQLLDFTTRSWGVGGWHNEDTTNWVCQGYFTMKNGKAGDKGQPSIAQMELVNPVWEEYLKPTLNLDDKHLKGHCHFSKKGCPGKMLQAWIESKWTI